MRNLLIAIGLAMAVWCGGCATTPMQAPAPALPTTAQAGTTTIVAVAPAASPPGCDCTLPQFLGITGTVSGLQKIGGRVRNRLGYRFPGLEPKPELLSITDPANTGEKASPVVKAAAEAKQAEDQAMQKAKAVRYLASLGCGKCYPDTEDALLKALDDCIEVVRYETAAGLRKRAGHTCTTCRSNSCCTPKLQEKLNKLAYETDQRGCFVEPSARVRRMARLALCGCGEPDVVTDPQEVSPEEGPTTEKPAGEAGAGPAPKDGDAAKDGDATAAKPAE